MAIALSLKATQSYGAPVPPLAVGSAFTPSNNSLLVCVIHALDLSGASPSTYTVSDTLGGTWTSQINFISNGGGNPTTLRVFTRPVTVGASMTVSISWSGGFGVHSDGFSNEANVFEITGHDTTSGTSFLGLTTTHADATTTGTSFSLGGTSAASSMVISSIDGDGDYGDPVIDEGAGWTALYKHVNGSGGGWQRQTTQYKSGAIGTIPWGASGRAYIEAYMAMEIIAASGGGAAATPYNPWPQMAPVMAQ